MPAAPARPQDAFEELARITLADHSLDTVMRTVARLAGSTVTGAAEVSVTLVERSTPRTIASTGDLATRLDERQDARGRGPRLASIAAGEPVASRHGAGSSMTLPVPVQRGVVAALDVHLHEARGRVAEQLEQAMRSRAVVEQAKGIVMGQRRCGAEAAFRLLVQLSQDSDRTLRDVARTLVDEVAGDGCER